MRKLATNRNKLSERRADILPAIYRRIQEAIINNAVANITSVKAHFDQIVLWGHYSPKDFEPLFEGNFRYDPSIRYIRTGKSDKWHYGRSYRVHKTDVSPYVLTVFFYPVTGGMPPCRIEINPEDSVTTDNYTKYLRWIDSSLPNLGVTGIEYTTDFYLASPRDVHNLFDLMLDYVRSPYLKNPKWTYMLETEESEELHLGKKNLLSAYFRLSGQDKIYPRGLDECRSGRGWMWDDVDRLRIEHTFTGWYDKKKYGIRTLSNFLNQPCFFYQVNKGAFDFCEFKGQGLPQPWEPREHLDPNGNAGMLQIEYLHYRHLLGRRMNKATVNPQDPDLVHFVHNIHEAWKHFDVEWNARTEG